MIKWWMRLLGEETMTAGFNDADRDSRVLNYWPALNGSGGGYGPLPVFSH